MSLLGHLGHSFQQNMLYVSQSVFNDHPTCKTALSKQKSIDKKYMRYKVVCDFKDSIWLAQKFDST